MSNCLQRHLPCKVVQMHTPELMKLQSLTLTFVFDVTSETCNKLGSCVISSSTAGTGAVLYYVYYIT